MAQGMWLGIERRTREAVGLADPAGSAGALLALLRHADDGWTWDEDPDAGWNRRADAFSQVIDALSAAGPAAVDAILAGDAPRGSWYAGAAAMALDELHGSGGAGGREGEVLDWLLRNVRDQNDAYMESTVCIVDRMGTRSVPALTRFVAGAEDGLLAMLLAHTLLEGADPAWAVPATEEMLRRLADGGAGLARVLGPVTALFSLKGLEASPAIRDALGRAAGRADGQDRSSDEMVAATLKGMLAMLDGLEDGLDGEVGVPLAGWDAFFGPVTGPLPCAGGDGECIDGCPLAGHFVMPEEINAVPRFLLERACKGLGLDAVGPKSELVRRLWEHHERELGLLVDPVPREELEAMPARELRELCEDLGLEDGGRKAELVGRLDRFFSGPPEEPAEPFAPWEVEAMTAAQLRTVCEDLGLPAGGRRAALVARVLEAQGERMK